mmetsp:Transcript_49400/g.161564  ORF Transcript_49400/g.161564 Transcript_49400/m.161564 type:complete len:275 (+) Transcript_49400:534-1358(+)
MSAARLAAASKLQDSARRGSSAHHGRPARRADCARPWRQPAGERGGAAALLGAAAAAAGVGQCQRRRRGPVADGQLLPVGARPRVDGRHRPRAAVCLARPRVPPRRPLSRARRPPPRRLGPLHLAREQRKPHLAHAERHLPLRRRPRRRRLAARPHVARPLVLLRRGGCRLARGPLRRQAARAAPARPARVRLPAAATPPSWRRAAGRAVTRAAARAALVRLPFAGPALVAVRAPLPRGARPERWGDAVLAPPPPRAARFAARPPPGAPSAAAR